MMKLSSPGDRQKGQRNRSTIEGSAVSGTMGGVAGALVLYLQDTFPGQPDSLWVLVSALMAFLAGGGMARLLDWLRYPAKVSPEEFIERIYNGGKRS